MANEHLIIAAIEGVRSEMNARFDALEGRLKTGDDLVEKHEERLTKVEHSLTRYRAFGTALSGIATFLGWDVIKHHWTSLMK